SRVHRCPDRHFGCRAWPPPVRTRNGPTKDRSAVRRDPMAVPVDVPDLFVLAGQLARANDGARPSKPEAILEQGGFDYAALHQVDGCRVELLVACRVENE